MLIEPFSMEGQGGGLAIALRRDGSFRKPDREALNAFADSVAIRLAAERSVEIERLRYGMEARERERTRWAREIHDESIQGIGALRMRLANARDLDDKEALSAAVEEALEGLGTEIDGLRHLITELRPAALDDLGLAAALEALARRAQAIDGLDVKTEIEFGRDEQLPAGEVHNGAGRLDPELESTIYRVVQEALTNVSRHAEATHAVIRLEGDERKVVASVTDDGKGMPDAAPARPARGRRRLRHRRDARARRARRRRAGVAAGARQRHDRAADGAAGGPPAARPGRRRAAGALAGSRPASLARVRARDRDRRPARPRCRAAGAASRRAAGRRRRSTSPASRNGVADPLGVEGDGLAAVGARRRPGRRAGGTRRSRRCGRTRRSAPTPSARACA